jgi:ATP-dependent Clp protease ATP-binding subunit ClpA
MNWFKSFWEGLNTPMGAGPESTGLNNFSPRAQQTLALARKEADRLQHGFVGTEHLLLGMIKLGQGTAVRVLGKMGVDLERVRREIEEAAGRGTDINTGNIPYTPRVKKALSLATKEARALHHTYLGTEHILLGLLREGDGVAARVLMNLGVNTDVTRQHILKELDPNISPSSTGAGATKKVELQNLPREPVDTSKRYDVYCREQNEQVVYRNALFKRVKTLFREREYDMLSEYLELEQADGQRIFIARTSVVKFCEHGSTPGSERLSGGNP